jgi:hypothetical protein
MLLNLIGTFIAGIGAAGAVMLFYRLIGKRAPGWLLPTVAGTAMLSFHIWNEYTWFDRASRALPMQVVVAEHYTYESMLQPWTLIAPRINRFAALDRTSIRRNKSALGYVMADIFLVTRLEPTAKVTQIYDCEKARRMDVSPSSKVDERGLPTDMTWIATGRGDSLFKLLCASS